MSRETDAGDRAQAPNPTASPRVAKRKKRKLRGWIFLLGASFLVVCGLALHSSEFRDLVVKSVASIWVMMGFSVFFLVGAATTVWSHRHERKTWRDTWDLAFRYVNSAGFQRPAVIVYLVFLGLLTWNVPARLDELSLAAKGERRVLNDRAKRQTNSTPQVAQSVSASDASNVLKTIEHATSDSIRRSEKAVIEMITKGGPAVLKEAAERKVKLPERIEVDQNGINPTSVDQIATAVDGILTKEAAQRALEKAEAPPDGPVLELSCRIVDRHVLSFIQALEKLARENGDQLQSDYKAAADLAGGKDNAYVRLERNAAWKFRVIFRKQQDARYHWHIDGPTDFFCSFDRDAYQFYLNTGVNGTGRNGGGKINDLVERTNLFDTLTWLVGVHKAKFPLTNYMIAR